MKQALKTNNPLVSVLMPVYNAEKYLKQAVNSVLNQSYTNFELIIINDGSTDNSEQIINSFNEKRVKYTKQANQGVANSLNKALQIATGEYIWRHDADDISNKNALQVQVEYLKNHSDIAIVSTRIAFMTTNGKIAHRFTNPSNDFYKGQYSKIITATNYWESRPIIHATILARKAAIINAGSYRTEFPTAEDIDLWGRVLENHRVAVINECNYFVRLHNSSNTSQHGTKNLFYRELAYRFFIERQEIGTDTIMRGEPMLSPPDEKIDNIKKDELDLAKKSKLFLNHILDYQYRIFVDAKDWKLVFKSIKIALRDGWKLKQTWKAILFPLLGKKIVNMGVRIKRIKS